MTLPLYDYDAPASNTAAVATLAGVAGFTVCARKAIFSTDGAPTSLTLTLKSGSDIISVFYITGGGLGALDLEGITAAEGEDLSATLSAPGAGVSGSVTLTGWLKDT